jgi:hypothetical protein
MPPLRPGRPLSFPAGDPRLVRFLRVRFWVYAVRHVLGVAVMAFLVALGVRAHETVLTGILGVGGLLYGGFAAYSAHSMWREWRRQEQVARDRAAATP